MGLLFVIVTQVLLGFLNKNLETVTDNSPMDEDWTNAFGILMCAVIRDGAGAGICDGSPSTCSNLETFLEVFLFCHEHVCIHYNEYTNIPLIESRKDIPRLFPLAS